MSLASVLATPACQNNACLPSTTCVSGPDYGAVVVTDASVISKGDAAASDGEADATADAPETDAPETDALTEPPDALANVDADETD